MSDKEGVTMIFVHLSQEEADELFEKGWNGLAEDSDIKKRVAEAERNRPKESGGKDRYDPGRYCGVVGTIDQVRMPESHGQAVSYGSPLATWFRELQEQDLRRTELENGLGVGRASGGKVVSGHDPVNRPDHYTTGGIEVIDIMEAKMGPGEFRGFLKGNVLKYSLRSELKGGVEDLKKAEWYLKRLIAFDQAGNGVQAP